MSDLEEFVYAYVDWPCDFQTAYEEACRRDEEAALNLQASAEEVR